MSEAERKRRYSAIVESAVDFAMVATDLNGIIREWNTGAEKVLGWTADEMSGKPLERFFTPEDRVGERSQIEMSLVREKGRAADERWHRRKDGPRL